MHLKNNTLLQGGKYRIVNFIASGGFGCTYEGLHTGLNQRVAIKEFFVGDFCNRDEVSGSVSVATASKREHVNKLREKFIDEAKALFRLRHPSIVHVHDVFEENGTAYYVMDFIDGMSLSEILKTSGAMGEKSAVSLIKKVAAAIDYVHKCGMLHLDIKPANIMLNSEGNTTLIDFGVAKQYDEDGGAITSTIVGMSPDYASPEQLSHELGSFSPATDIYALGATLYALLTGQAPPRAAALVSGQKTLEIPGHVSAPIANAIRSAMAMRVLDRPASVEAFVRMLDVPTQSNAGVRGTQNSPSFEATRTLDHNTTRTYTIDSPPPVMPNPPAPVQVEDPQPKNNSMLVGIIIGLSIIAIIAMIFVIIDLNEDVDEEAVTSEQMDASGEKQVSKDEVVISSSPLVTYNKAHMTFSDGANEVKMVQVPAGTFDMGADGYLWDDARNDELPVHTVSLDSYYIASTETPQWLWTAVMGSNPSVHTGSSRPVENVSYNSIREFLNRLNSLTGQNFVLPTEAQWEYAARGGSANPGYRYSGSDDINQVAWYKGNSGGTTHDVGQKMANALGLYDMSGNVFEWCRDWKGNYTAGFVSNPTGASSGTQRAGRGGSCLFDSAFQRVSFRAGSKANYSSGDLGFRLAME